MEASVILNAADLKAEELETTTKKILANSEKFYLLSAALNMKLYDVIDSLSKTLKDKAALTCVRFAYNIYFELETEIRIGDSGQGVKVQSLAELLDKLEYDENLILQREDYHIVINDDGVEPKKADKAVAELFQQTVFLNINIDIKKKSEIKKSLIKKSVREKYLEIKENKKFFEEIFSSSNKIVESFDSILAELDKIKLRPIRVAVFGGKKAGKSTLTNCLLKRDYVPTSAVLPTPNTIKYIPAGSDSPIILDYKGRKAIFDSAKVLSDFIGYEFKSAQKITGEGSGLEDMTIYYPCDDLNGYEIWDTPGPNVAFTDEYRKQIETCIKAADVCIFVMNYSNRLTIYEVEFLKYLHEVLEKNNKLNSLIFVVNRIDELYVAEVEKSVVRVLDYIGEKLKYLGYKDIVIFGTSALQSFYLHQVLSILKDLEMEVDDENTFYDVVRQLGRKHLEYKTQTRFLQDALGNLEDFCNIEEPDAKTLENFSGIPQLLKYVKYVGGKG